MSTPFPASGSSVDAQHPWLGLVSFTEETRSYFHGREEEVAELGRRVQRRLLTVLFGQSGLGKTSILQAGLVPRLRSEGYCPVYVRLDYDPHSPPPAEQIKRAVLRATTAAGTWTRSGSAVAGETLWEFLHHRDDILRDAAGRPLTPLLIFDQFEEIFTLAQTDDVGRRRAQEFLADLADLVENRPPAALEARIERDEADAGRFDFARADYRILISLREDYLAHLEGLKAAMPAVTQNRMRLARMTGAQALAAVRRPAPSLVSETVAESIVCFVAGGAGLAVAEVEPSLLSLICRELNNARFARGQPEISADLLAGSRDTILSEYYERSLAGQPDGVRRFVEDELLTDSGFRESVAEERVRKSFAAVDAAPDTLAQLVDRRLLRVEDRLDQRRVEITHDVLCSVIAASRNVRHEREALEESQRQLAAQRARDAATRESLTRARTVAAVATTLLVLAVASAVFGWVNLRRARTAERATAETRALAEAARAEAEKIVSYLVDDFYQEFEPLGGARIIVDLTARADAYYRGLPPGLRTRDTQRNHGLALARHGAALNSLNRTGEAEPILAESIALLEALWQTGDRSPETARGLALALLSQADLLGNQARELESRNFVGKGLEVLRPVATVPGASRPLRREYARALVEAISHRAQGKEALAVARAQLAEARLILNILQEEAPDDLAVILQDGYLKRFESDLARQSGEAEAALNHAREAEAAFRRVVEQRPGHGPAIAGLGAALGRTALALARLGRTSEALVFSERAAEQTAISSRLNPGQGVQASNLLAAADRSAFYLTALGRLREANDVRREFLALENKITMSSQLAAQFSAVASRVAWLEAQLGNIEATERAVADCNRLFLRAMQDQTMESARRLLQAEFQQSMGLLWPSFQGEAGDEYLADSLAKAHGILTRAEQFVPRDDIARAIKSNLIGITRNAVWRLSRRLHRWTDFEASSRKQLLEAEQQPAAADDEGRLGVELLRLDLAEALARQGRWSDAWEVADSARARTLLEAVVARFPEHQQWMLDGVHYHLVLALLSRDDPAVRHRDVSEARRLMEGIGAEWRSTSRVRDLIKWLEAEEAGQKGGS